MSAPVVETVTADLLPGEPDAFPWGVSAAGAVPVQVELRWEPADPMAVRLAFHIGPGGPVVWTVARELLATGLLMAAGAGDVRLRPHGDVLVVRLRNHTPQQAWFSFTAGPVAEFLEATYERVPLREERVDPAEWDHLLRIGGAGGWR